MKKIFLSVVLAASSWMLFAQDTTNQTTNQQVTDQKMNSSTNQNTNLNNNANQNTTSNQVYNATSNYNAYAIPNYVQTNFQTQYPNVSNLTWTAPTADWYHGYYSDANGRYTHVYYSTDPYYNVKYYPERIVGYTVSLPVLQTFVPDQVITTATNLYKQNLYDITALRAKDSQQVYQVRVQDNGELKSMWMDANGTAITDYWRTEEQMNMTDANTQNATDTNAAMDNNSMNNMNNNAKTKTKTEMSNGSELKTKTKNGKTRTKTSGNNQL